MLVASMGVTSAHRFKFWINKTARAFNAHLFRLLWWVLRSPIYTSTVELLGEVIPGKRKSMQDLISIFKS